MRSSKEMTTGSALRIPADVGSRSLQELSPDLELSAEMTELAASAALADPRDRVPQYCTAEGTDTAGGLATYGEQDLTTSTDDAEQEGRIRRGD